MQAVFSVTMLLSDDLCPKVTLGDSTTCLVFMLFINDVFVTIFKNIFIGQKSVLCTSSYFNLCHGGKTAQYLIGWFKKVSHNLVWMSGKLIKLCNFYISDYILH